MNERPKWESVYECVLNCLAEVFVICLIAWGICKLLPEPEETPKVEVLQEQPLVEVEPEEPVINVTCVVNIIIPPKFIIDEYECELLAHLIYAEAGSDWCSDKLQVYTGSVVLNRVKHKDYPNSLHAVVYQQGQYSCTWNGMIEYDYNERAYACARYLLTHGSQIPENVVYQANFEQGDGVYEAFEGMYFCYKGDK